MTLYNSKGEKIDKRDDETKVISFTMDNYLNDANKRLAESIYHVEPEPVLLTDKYGDVIGQSRKQPGSMVGISKILEDSNEEEK